MGRPRKLGIPLRLLNAIRMFKSSLLIRPVLTTPQPPRASSSVVTQPPALAGPHMVRQEPTSSTRDARRNDVMTLTERSLRFGTYAAADCNYKCSAATVLPTTEGPVATREQAAP